MHAYTRSLIAAAMLAACGGPTEGDPDGGIDATAGECAGATDGTTCGPTSVCVAGACAESACGDGAVDARTEECDDGNEAAFDGCEPSVCTFTCGEDGDCDDAQSCNGVEVCNGDHVCAAGTVLDDGTSCELASGDPSACRAGECVLVSCGDGAVAAGEECDDGNVTNGDGCQVNCTFTCESDIECADTACTGTVACDTSEHVCTSSTCAASDPCHSAVCLPETGCFQAVIDGDGDGAASTDFGTCGSDCDDANPDVILLEPWYADCDDDGFAGEYPTAPLSCGPPAAVTPCPGGGGTWIDVQPVGAGRDCNDGNAAINPSATETPANGVDDNCDGVDACFLDRDADGFMVGGTDIAPCGSTGTISGTLPTGDCCDTSNPTHPGQTTCSSMANPCGSFDFDCDGAAEPCLGDFTACSDPTTGDCIFDGDGFTVTVACGASGAYRTCSARCLPIGDPDCELVCTSANTTRTQTCL